MSERARIAILGLNGWYEIGGVEDGSTWSCGPKKEEDLTAPVRVDMSGALEASDNPARDIWRRPNLDLRLSDDNVRNLCEGCIGFPGTTAGHPWDGDLERLRPSDSVDLDVYLAVLKATGGKIVRS
jgi:hypothetical protein